MHRLCNIANFDMSALVDALEKYIPPQSQFNWSMGYSADTILKRGENYIVIRDAKYFRF